MRFRCAVFIVLLLSFLPTLARGEENPFLAKARIKLIQAKKIVILPFSSTSRNPMEIESRRLLFAIRQRFESMGKLVMPEEDVWKLLREMNLVERKNEYQKKLEEQLETYGFSKEMHEYLKENDPRLLSEPFMLALTKEEIKKIGSYFKADIIVRGCIVDYGTMDVSSGSPLSQLLGGIAPFVTAQRIGVAIAIGSYIPSTDKQGVVQMTIHLCDGESGELLYGKSLFSTYKPLFSNLKSKAVLLQGAIQRALETFFEEFSEVN
ncbi:MAG: hypothetical protein H5T91_00660 [Synergistetes bacterium]|nr:MAG: hypothetical protein XD52_0462 [bacterium 42_11]MBC7330928.1 hypothetical protein [Synergistota bacterium]MDK2870889.1 hypothetical protein [bacterium]